MERSPQTDLFAEHRGIVLMLEIMKKVAEKIRNTQEVDKDHLDKIIEFLKIFADKCHHGKEELILFPELLKNNKKDKFINELLGEHKTGRDFIRGIAESKENYAVGNPDAIHIAVNMEGYIRLLLQHIKKENNVIFPLVDKEISLTAKNNILKKFEKMEIEVVGQGKHEQYHGWLEELASFYLK